MTIWGEPHTSAPRRVGEASLNYIKETGSRGKIQIFGQKLKQF